MSNREINGSENVNNFALKVDVSGQIALYKVILVIINFTPMVLY